MKVIARAGPIVMFVPVGVRIRLPTDDPPALFLNWIVFDPPAFRTVTCSPKKPSAIPLMMTSTVAVINQ
jgi:hypothetical protein